MTKDYTAYKIPPFNTLGYNVVKGIFLPTLLTSPYSSRQCKEKDYLKLHVLQVNTMWLGVGVCREE